MTDGEPEVVASASLQKIKSIKNPIKLSFLFLYFIKSETSDSFVTYFDGHFADLKTLDFYFNYQRQQQQYQQRMTPPPHADRLPPVRQITFDEAEDVAEGRRKKEGIRTNNSEKRALAASYPSTPANPNVIRVRQPISTSQSIFPAKSPKTCQHVSPTN